MADWPPSQSSIYAMNTATPNLADLYNNAYIPMADEAPLQLSIDALNTTTPNLVDLYI